MGDGEAWSSGHVESSLGYHSWIAGFLTFCEPRLSVLTHGVAGIPSERRGAGKVGIFPDGRATEFDHAAEVVYTADYSGCLHVISPFSVCICNAGWRQLTRADTALPDESVRTSTEKRGDAAASQTIVNGAMSIVEDAMKALKVNKTATGGTGEDKGE